MQRTKWQGKTSGGNIGQKSLLFLMRILNIRLAYLILALIVPFRMLFARKAFKAIYRFFRKRNLYSPWRAFLATYRNHYVFGQTLIDKFAVFAGKRDFLKIEIEGQTYYNEAIAKENGVLFAGAHVGNFEILGYLLPADTKPINTLIYGNETAVIKANRQQVFESQNVKVIPIMEDMSHVFLLSHAADKGEIISILCDRYMEGNKCINLNFMGSKARFPLGAFVIAKRFELSVLTIFVLKQSWCSYKVIINKIDGETPSEISLKFAASLEDTVRKYPYQWFNFYEFFDE